MGAELNQKLFSAADNLRSKMDASEYKNYLLGLIFYKYLSDKLLVEVVEQAGESSDDYPTAKEQTVLFEELLNDDDTRSDLISTLNDTLNYMIEPEFLFNTLADEAKQNLFQLTDLRKAFSNLSNNYDQFIGLFDDVDLSSRKLGNDEQQQNITISEVLKS